MHFLTFHSGTLVLFTLLTISYALPTIDYGSTSELIERDKTKPKPKPKTPVKKPDAAKSKTQATGLHDGQVPNNYKPKIHTRDIEGLDEILQARGLNMDSINDLDARDFHYDLLEARKGGHGAAEAIVDVVTGIVNLIKDKIKEDNEARGKFTQEVVANGREKFPHFNWVACHTKHKTEFDGEQGKEWGHQHHEVDIKVGGTIGYEIYWFRGGTFHREGDGGYLNWAWNGFPKEVKDDGATVIFNAPP